MHKKGAIVKSGNAECEDTGSPMSLKCLGGQVELGEESDGDWGKERRGSRAGQGWGLEGIISISLQILKAGPTEGSRERLR